MVALFLFVLAVSGPSSAAEIPVTSAPDNSDFTFKFSEHFSGDTVPVSRPIRNDDALARKAQEKALAACQPFKDQLVEKLHKRGSQFKVTKDCFHGGVNQVDAYGWDYQGSVTLEILFN